MFTASLLYPASRHPPPPRRELASLFTRQLCPPGRPITLCSGTLLGTRDHPTPGAVTARAAASQPRRAAALGSWRSALVTPRGAGADPRAVPGDTRAGHPGLKGAEELGKSSWTATGRRRKMG